MGNAQSSPRAGAYALEGLKTIVNILQDLSDDLPVPASPVINLVQRVITTLDDVRSNREECELLKTRLLQLLAVVMMAVQEQSTGVDGKPTIPANLQGNVERFQRKLEDIEKEVNKIAKVANSKRKRHRLSAVFWVKAHAATLQSCRDELEWAMNLFNVSSHLSDAVRLWETSKKVEQVLSNQNLMTKKTQTIITNSFLESLPRAKYASFDCERPDKPSTCFEGTRTAILDLITDWITNPDPAAPHFFWLNGIAGIGKTTVACTIAKLMQDLGLLGGQFCFSRRGEAELRNPALVFPTIAYQLARFDPEFGRRITTALEADPEAPYASLKQQLDRLILDPLKGLERDPKRVVVLIFDAFDECESRGAKEILQLLIAAMPSLPVFLKIFVTSRPEHHIRSVLVPATNLSMTALHDIETSVVRSDILLYLRHSLRKLGEERKLPSGWITESDIALLAEKAGNLFIHVATVIRFLSKGVNPRTQLITLMKIVTSVTPAGGPARPFSELDKLYQEILLNLIPDENPEDVATLLRLVLGSIVLLRDPLPVDALERLIGLASDDASMTLEHLHSVILTPPPPDDCPRAYHPSFADFLQDHGRCTDDRLWIATEEHEGRMALRCLEILNAGLHKGMLGELDPTLLNSEVEDLANKVRGAFPPELQYACLYWASHLANASRSKAEVRAALEVFASHSLLPWMEAMSWLGKTGPAVRCLEAANLWQAKSGNPSSTTVILNDGYRLLLAHRPAIGLGAQHLATSVLPFAPSNVELTARYSGYANANVKVVRGVDPEWSPCLMVWNGHSSAVTSVAYSPDGSRAASASGDKTIRLWDTTTGSCATALEGHSSYVMSVAFSPDGSTLASGSWDRNIRTWDSTTGACITVLEGHSNYINSVSFSSNGSRLVSGSNDRTIRLWDFTTRATIATFRGHSGEVRSAVFSPDGSQIASGSADKTIRIWDLTGRCVNILEGHSGIVHSVTFSPNGTYLASGSRDSTVRIWDTATSKCTSIFEGHSNGVEGVAFSPDGTRLASASFDATIRVWNTATGECTNTFRGHSNAVVSVAFSPDGSRLISGSEDNTVRIWDATLTTPTTTSEGHSSQVMSVAFSKDGSRLVSGSYDHTARIWDATTGRCLTKLEGHSTVLYCVAFNPDGTLIAIGSADKTVRLWDANTGDHIATLSGHSSFVMSLVFSADGAYLKSADLHNNTLFWDVPKAEKAEKLDDSQFDRKALDLFKIDDGRLTRTYEDGSQRLVCILPPGTPTQTIASAELGGERYRAAIGCTDGEVFILEISMPLD